MAVSNEGASIATGKEAGIVTVREHVSHSTVTSDGTVYREILSAPARMEDKPVTEVVNLTDSGALSKRDFKLLWKM